MKDPRSPRATVLPFKKTGADSPAFSELLQETLGAIDAAADQLIERVVSLAMIGPWRVWSDQQPIGALWCGSDEGLVEALSDCGDARIKRLAILWGEMQDVLTELRQTKESL